MLSSALRSPWNASRSRLFDFAHDLIRKVCNFSGSCASAFPAPPRSMQPRRLEEAAAVGRGDLVLDAAAVAFDRDRDFGAGAAERPDAPEHAGKRGDLLPGDGEHDVAGV